MGTLTTYREKFDGVFHGVLQWRDVETLWDFLRANSKDWYVYDPQGDVPHRPLGSDDFAAFVREAEALTAKRRERPFCGSIYVDDKSAPTFIKIFDPTNMGSSCSCSVEGPMPAFIVSKKQPEALVEEMPVEIEERGLFKRMFGRA